MNIDIATSLIIARFAVGSRGWKVDQWINPQLITLITLTGLNKPHEFRGHFHFESEREILYLSVKFTI